jgi:hypothetical protein
MDGAVGVGNTCHDGMRRQDESSEVAVRQWPDRVNKRVVFEAPLMFPLIGRAGFRMSQLV